MDLFANNFLVKPCAQKEKNLVGKGLEITHQLSK